MSFIYVVFLKPDFEKRYVAKYVSTYSLTSFLLTAGVLEKKENNTYKRTITQDW